MFKKVLMSFKKLVRLTAGRMPRKQTSNMRLPPQQQIDLLDAAEIKRLRKQARYAKQYKGDLP